MQSEITQFAQPVGWVVSAWNPPPRLAHVAMSGAHCRLEPLEEGRHAEALFAANREDVEGRMWTYLAYGPFTSIDEYRAWMRKMAGVSGAQFYAIVDLAGGRPVGVAAYWGIDPAAGSIEVGSLAYSPALQRTVAATEAMYLMMKNAFELGYRRYEWKCNALNAPSRRAAERLGFTFEGIFRQAAVVKGCNRDTAWFSIIDSEWPRIREGFVRWLSPENFDEQGRQWRSLGELRGGE